MAGRDVRLAGGTSTKRWFELPLTPAEALVAADGGLNLTVSPSHVSQQERAVIECIGMTVPIRAPGFAGCSGCLPYSVLDAACTPTVNVWHRCQSHHVATPFRQDMRMRQVGPAAAPARRPRIDQLEAYVQPRAAVASAAAGPGHAPGSGAQTGADASLASRAALAAAPLLPGHCRERPASQVDAEQSLQDTLQATTAAATFARLVEGAEARLQEQQAPLRTTALRVLAPPVAVAKEWLPASETTNAAWLLARAASEHTVSTAASGEPGSKDGAEQVDSKAEGELHDARDRAALEDALGTLQRCSSDMADGATWREAGLRGYMVSAAMVRQLAGCCVYMHWRSAILSSCLRHTLPGTCIACHRATLLTGREAAATHVT